MTQNRSKTEYSPWRRVSRTFFDGGDPPAFDAGNDSYLQHVPEASRSHFEGIGSFNDLTTRFVELSTKKPDGFNATDNSFVNHLPEDIRGEFGSVPNLEALGRGYLSAQKLIGKDPGSLITKPIEGDAAGQLAALQALGAPGDLAGWGDMKTLAGENGDPAFIQNYIEKVALPTGMMPHQLKANLEFVAAVAKETGEQRNAQSADQVAKWQAEMAQGWGVEVGSASWKENIAKAASVIEDFGGDDLFEAIEQTSLGDNPLFVNAMLQIATKLQGGSLEGTGGNGPALTGRAADLDRQIKDLQAKQMAAMDGHNQVEARNIASQITRLIEEKNRLIQKQGG